MWWRIKRLFGGKRKTDNPSLEAAARHEVDNPVNAILKTKSKSATHDAGHELAIDDDAHVGHDPYDKNG